MLVANYVLIFKLYKEISPRAKSLRSYELQEDFQPMGLKDLK
jgi:hypothetical protein